MGAGAGNKNFGETIILKKVNEENDKTEEMRRAKCFYLLAPTVRRLIGGVGGILIA